ncbi:hypothetical protein [Shewanella acanthi]|uniref:hypothetical protein n=1 Tax=Shewanella acanthi TaxID=2864212 RepID=UPI001C65CFCB|nr:hypothetical protein [Shewanella acanthi]QYJ79431.1 hypothetical protein K0H61_03000 [Shewanella acanthi]
MTTVAPTIVDSIPISADLLWLNRNAQQRVASNIKRALNGAPHINMAPIPSGFVMELGTKEGGMSRAEFTTLQTHANTTLTEFNLSFEGTNYTVMWDSTQGAPISGDDIFDEVGGFATLTNVTLKLLIL